MRLKDLETSRLLPTWMRGDEVDLALAHGVDEAMRSAAPDLDLLGIWDALDALPEAYLDELAWALDIRWYDSGAPIETKRGLVANSDQVHRKLGTVAAVESVVSDYFGVGRVREWPEYGGLPHHFKVFTTDPSAVNENLVRFLDLLRKIKRLSSVFDGVQIGLTGEQYAHCGMGVRDCSIRTVYLGVDIKEHEVEVPARAAAVERKVGLMTVDLGVRRGSTVETVEANKAATSHTATYRTIQLGAQAPGGE